MDYSDKNREELVRELEEARREIERLRSGSACDGFAEILKAQKLESIGLLAAGIAHDFNNILLGILGNASLAKNYVNDPKASGLLASIEEAANRAKGLTRQLLTFSKGGEPIREVARIEQLVKDSAGLILRDSNVNCVFSFAKDLRSVDIDEGQISQVINNIVLNALQAMEGSGTIGISAENVSAEKEARFPVTKGDYVRITIKDSGPGITEDNIDRVFDPFFTTKNKASGLGLAVSYSIIKKHKGFLSVESSGDGASFHILLSSAPEKQDKPPVEEKAVRGRGKVLVMDDERLIREVTGEMLDFLGYEAEFAAEGIEAVRMAREAKEAGSPFLAAILDLTIPGGMGGKEAVSKILEIDPEIKAIVSSGYSKDPIMSDFGKYGFSGVIAKPYTVAEFSSVVNSVLAGNG